MALLPWGTAQTPKMDRNCPAKKSIHGTTRTTVIALQLSLETRSRKKQSSHSLKAQMQEVKDQVYWEQGHRRRLQYYVPLYLWGNFWKTDTPVSSPPLEKKGNLRNYPCLRPEQILKDFSFALAKTNVSHIIPPLEMKLVVVLMNKVQVALSTLPTKLLENPLKKI